MSRVLVPLLLLALLGAGALLLLRPPGAPPPSSPDLDRRAGDDGTDVDPDRPARPALQSAPEATAPRPRGPTWPVIPSDRIRRGRLEVKPYGPDLEPLAVDAVRIRIERLGAPFWAEPVGLRDPETRTWSFRDVPYGKVVVHAWGDHLEHQTKEAEVKAGQTTEVELFLERAGAVAFEATLPEGKTPASVTVRLLSPRTNLPVEVHFQTREATLLTTDVRATEATLGPKGLLFGVPAGRYVLEAESEEGDRDSADVEVRVGETTEVELRFAY